MLTARGCDSLLAPELLGCQAQKLFAAVTFKTQISCEVFTTVSQLRGRRGGGDWQGAWSRGSGEAGETWQEADIPQMVGRNSI